VCRLNLGEAGAYIHEGECYPARILAEHNNSASQGNSHLGGKVLPLITTLLVAGELGKILEGS
jgi:hypothetical protein